MNICNVSHVTITVFSLASIMSFIALYSEVIPPPLVTKEVTRDKNHFNVYYQKDNTEKDLPPS